jgi:hypothetical protein
MAGIRSALRALLFDSRGLTTTATQIVELRTAHSAAANHFNAGYGRGMEWEDTFDPDTTGDLADHERLIDAPTLTANANTLEHLNPLFRTLANAVQDFNGVTRSEVQGVFPELLFLDFFDYVSHSRTPTIRPEVFRQRPVT